MATNSFEVSEVFFSLQGLPFTLPLLRTPPSAHASPASMPTSSSISNGSASIPSPTQACATCRVQTTPRSNMALRPRAASPPSVHWRHRCRHCRRCWSCVSWYIRRVTASTGKTPCTGASSSACSSRWRSRSPRYNSFTHSSTFSSSSSCTSTSRTSCWAHCFALVATSTSTSRVRHSSRGVTTMSLCDWYGLTESCAPRFWRRLRNWRTQSSRDLKSSGQSLRRSSWSGLA